MSKILKFPKGFLWGTATSSYQVEGGIKNDWTEFYDAGITCNYYNLYEKDFDLIKSFYQNAYRFSVEWARVEPEEGKFNEKEIEHYQEMILALKERNITPFLTLHHFTNPIWFYEKGGWENQKATFYFSRFVEKIVNNFKNLVEFWITFNEPKILISHGFLSGEWPPFKKNIFSAARIFKNIKKSHQEVFKVIKGINSDLKVGIVNVNDYFEPFRKDNILDRAVSNVLKYFSNDIFWKDIDLDFIGLNYYSRNRAGFRSPFRKSSAEKTIPSEGVFSDIGWEVYPQGIYHVLRDLKEYNLPIYITENGLADAKDQYRKDFIKDHLFYVHKAIDEGVDVKGYFHWSLMDNFEWAKGFTPRFGLVEIDYKTMERKPRSSALYYAEICKENALIANSHEYGH